MTERKEQLFAQVMARKSRAKPLATLLVVVAVAILGVYLIRYSSAAGSAAAVEAESGTHYGAAVKIDNAPAASGNSFIKFGNAATPNPNPTPTPPVPVGSKVVFVGNFDDGTGKSIGNFDSAKKPYSLQVMPDGPDHPTAGRIELHSGEGPSYGGNRAEFRVENGADVSEGDERWYEFSIKLPADFKNPTGVWFLVMQWHHEANSGSPPLGLNINSDGAWRIGGDGVSTQYHRKFSRVKPGQWVKFVIHAKFSKSASTGFVEVYEDGVLVVPKYNRPTMVDGGNYLKYGIYRDDEPTVHVVYHDDLRITAP